MLINIPRLTGLIVEQSGLELRIIFQLYITVLLFSYQFSMFHTNKHGFVILYLLYGNVVPLPKCLALVRIEHIIFTNDSID